MPRGSYTKDEQDAIIRDLCEIPKKFKLSLVCGYVDRRALRFGVTRAEQTEAAQTMASAAGAHFADKTDASVLQIADACVFATKRHLAGQDKECFFGLLSQL